jgi:hypothetical protein
MMQYILTGFTEKLGFRVFAFDYVSKEKVRSSYVVKTDLALTRKYGIRMQELPLLCRSVLERKEEGNEQHSHVYSEADMRAYADVRSVREAAVVRRKIPRRPMTTDAASGEAAEI